MKIRLNRKYLDNRYSGMINLKTEPCRVAYVPKGDINLPEYVLTYKSTDKFPTPQDDLGLYDVPHYATDKSGPGKAYEEIWMIYRNATVILITQDKDDKFRKENKKTILDLEAFCVEK